MVESRERGMGGLSVKVPQARRLPSGSWFCRVRVNGRDIGVTRATEKEAIAEAMALKAGAIKEKKTPAAQKTVGQIVDEYIESRSAIVSPSTLRAYEKIRRCRFQIYMGRKVSNISPAQWQRAINAEAQQVSAKTVKNSWGLIHAAIAYSTGEDIRVALPKVVPPDLPFLDREQISIFCEAIRGTEVEIPALLALESLRRSEILALTWENIDLKGPDGRILVRGAAVVGPNNDLVQKDTNKNQTSRREIPFILPQLREALERVPPDQRTGLVFGRRHESYTHRAVNRICEQHGLPKVGVHGLRRSFATLCHGLGIPERYTMQWGGWSNINTVHAVYVKLDNAAASEFSRRFTAFFKSGNENGNGPSGSQE